MTRHIAIIGAGPGGLTAAMILARRGFRVTLCEAQSQVGGRNAAIRSGPYTFDIGPTFLMLPEVLDSVFQDAGADARSLLDLRPLDPMYRLQFGDKQIDSSVNPDRMKAEIARVFPGLEGRYDRFVAQERERFRRLYPCLATPYHTPGSLLSRNLLKAFPHLALGRSLFQVMRKTFGDDELALAFTFQSKYLGMSPWNCPGFFSIIPYIEHAHGILHPTGGLSRISDRMAEVARRHGALLRMQTPVEQVLVRDRLAVGVRLAGGEVVEADEVVINADFGHAATHLFAPGVLRKYTPERLSRMQFSCSTFMLYLGLDTTYDHLPHHTIFFAKNYRDNVNRIFGGRELTDDLSFYVRNPGGADPTLAPAGCSALYVLVPVPNLRGAIDWSARRDAYREMTLQTLETRAGLSGIRGHIRAEHVITPRDWQETYRVHEGATFNLAHTVNQMLYFRPRNRFEEVGNCYLVGGGTHPGSGLPTIYESGRISANLISQKYGATVTSGLSLVP
jgi:phytoene desaturase